MLPFLLWTENANFLIMAMRNFQLTRNFCLFFKSSFLEFIFAKFNHQDVSAIKKPMYSLKNSFSLIINTQIK